MDIASAPVVALEQQEFGNTASDAGAPSTCRVFESWWRLPVAAGDTAIVDFEGNVDYVNLWPVGTTDFNLNNNTSGVQAMRIGANGKQEATFTAAVPGTMPLEFAVDRSCSFPGPYDFTVRILHGVVLALPVHPCPGGRSRDLPVAWRERGCADPTARTGLRGVTAGLAARGG